MREPLARAKVSIALQQMQIWHADVGVLTVPVNTAKNGVGCVRGSECTPIGLHYVRAAIGEGLPELAVLRGRRPTGELWSASLAAEFPHRDWILGRILWLCGLEKGVNRGGELDSFRRYIYLHGSPEAEVLTHPSSHGCIRLTPSDMVKVYALLSVGSQIEIHP